MNSTEAADQPESRPCRNGRKRFIKIPFIIAAVVLLKSAVVMFLWNDLATELFHAPVVSFLQAIEITILAKALFGFGGRGMMMGGMGRGRMWQRLGNLSPEERERFRADLHKRC